MKSSTYHYKMLHILELLFIRGYSTSISIYPYIRLLQETCSSGRQKSDSSCKKPCRRSRFLQDLARLWPFLLHARKIMRLYVLLQASCTCKMLARVGGQDSCKILAIYKIVAIFLHVYKITRLYARFLQDVSKFATSFLQEPFCMGMTIIETIVTFSQAMNQKF